MSKIGIGDKVVCLRNGLSSCPNSAHHRAKFAGGPPSQVVAGRVYTVVGIAQGGIDGFGLLLAEAQPRGPVGFCAGSFRKVEKADEGFTTWMATLREERVPFRVPASVDRSGEAGETALAGSTEGESAVGAEGAETPKSRPMTTRRIEAVMGEEQGWQDIASAGPLGLLRRLTEGEVARYGSNSSTMIRAGLLLDIINELEALRAKHPSPPEPGK